MRMLLLSANLLEPSENMLLQSFFRYSLKLLLHWSTLAEIFLVLKDISRPAISWLMTSQIFSLPKSLVPLQIMMITGSSSAVGIR